LPFEEINRKAIVYLGVLEELQGVQLVIEAFKQILKVVPDASFTIIGSGVFEAKLKQMVGQRHLEGQIKFTGLISDEDARGILCSSSVGVAPYFDDSDSNTRFTEPTKPKTYLSCGLPVIITRVPKIAFEIEKAGAGIAINYSQEELNGALIKMLTDDSSYKEYRQNAITFAAKYDWQNIFEGAFKRSFEPCLG
jgi:glycosyltransferase involved in cell wall biosynthesis